MIRHAFCLLLLLVAAGCSPAGGGGSAAMGSVAPDPDGSTVLITGSNRGLGLAFATNYAEAGWKVIATTRQPESATELQELAKQHPKVSIERLDVTDEAGVDALAKKLQGTPIDVLINNAGVRGELKQQSLGSFDYKTFEQTMAVNVYGPLRVSQAFLGHVAASKQKKIVAVTSRAGSLSTALGKPRGLCFYQISKAGLNMGMVRLASDAAKRGIVVGLFSPGQVDTDMWRMDGNTQPATDPREASAGLMKLIAGLVPANSGQFFQVDGTPIPW